MNDIRLGAAKAKPGEKRWGQLLVREGKESVKLPTCVVNGIGDGEHVVVIANQHGGEINGVESIRLFCEAASEGLVCPRKANDAPVKKGEVVCHVVDPFRGRIVEECRAPMSGAIYSIYAATHKPKYVCQKGDPLFAVGHARQVKAAKLCREMGPEPYRCDPWGPE